MTTTLTSGAAIQRYKIDYHSYEWGPRSITTTSGIPDASGSWVRYADHIAALAAGRATAAQAQPAAAPMSPANRLVAYSAATRLRDLGFEWDATAEAWLQPAQPAAPAGDWLWVNDLFEIIDAARAARTPADDKKKDPL